MTVAVVVPVGGWLNSSNRNSSVRMLVTISFSVAMLTWPDSTAAWSAGP